jgi:cell division protein FtsB
MAKKDYKLSPTDKLNYVQKAKPEDISGKGGFFKRFSLTFLLLVVLSLILIPYFEKKEKQRALEEEIRKVEEEINMYEVKSLDLEELIGYLQSDQAVEERARVNFGLQKEGEKVVVIKREESEEALGESKEEEVEISQFKKWCNYFFK